MRTGNLKLYEREIIENDIKREVPITVIARKLGVCRSTIYREIDRHKSANGDYNAAIAHAHALENNKKRGGRRKEKPI